MSDAKDGDSGTAAYPEAGLCDRCRHAEILTSKRSRFLRCGLADTDARFARYPRLPVLACAGYSGATVPGAPG